MPLELCMSLMTRDPLHNRLHDVSVHYMQGNQVLRFSPNDLSYMSITARMNSREDCPEGIAFAKGCLYVAR